MNFSYQNIYNGAKRYFIICIRAIFSEKYPIIITFIVASIGTYIISPYVNEKFERQKMQASYVLDNLHQFNELISDLYVQITAINYNVAKTGSADIKNVKSARDDIAKLNWKIVETASILNRKEDIDLLFEFKQSISDVNDQLNGNLNTKSCLILMSKVNIMAKNASKVINTISNHVDL